jgi:hypothetical protein
LRSLLEHDEYSLGGGECKVGAGIYGDIVIESILDKINVPHGGGIPHHFPQAPLFGGLVPFRILFNYFP